MEPITQQSQVVQEPLFELESLAVSSHRSVGTIKQQIKEAKDMLQQSFEANETYKTNRESLKTVQKTLSQTKQSLLQVAGNAEVTDKIKSLRQELKDKVVEISDYALEYERLSGNTQIERDGELFEIVKVAKLIKKPAF